MSYSKDLISSKLVRWEKFIESYHLPTWNELPSLELYMDQVIILLSQYLGFIPLGDNDEKLITASIINNYVRMKVVPPPVKKKYSRIHIAYLIMICVLKQSLNIAEVQKIIPCDLSEEEVAAVYTDFADKHSYVAGDFVKLIRTSAADILDPTNTDSNTVDRFVIETALTANYFKILTQKIIRLQDSDVPVPEVTENSQS